MTLQPTRFTCNRCHHLQPCALTARFHPYLSGKDIGGLFSVALSVIRMSSDEFIRVPDLSAGVVLCAVRTFLTMLNRAIVHLLCNHINNYIAVKFRLAIGIC